LRTTWGVLVLVEYVMTPVMPMKRLGKWARSAAAHSGESV